jgi:imidazolonepropionase-like amidohydrolase
MILIKNAYMMTMAGDVIPKGFVFSDHGKIVHLGSMDVCPSDLQDVFNKTMTVIDADGRFLLPGLVDAHSHLGMIAEVLKETTLTKEPIQSHRIYVRWTPSIPETVDLRKPSKRVSRQW